MPGFVAPGPNDLYGVLSSWGAFHGDLGKQLDTLGFKTIETSGGPVSSSYDRAVEIYTQLVGGQVDYGAAHSEKYGHNRYGEIYDIAKYPEISSVNKVHLISHSFGGMDCR